jgi:hypothetical protein
MDSEPKPRRKNKSKPVQRSLESLKRNGWTVAIVERHLPPRGLDAKGQPLKFGKTIDVFGFGDLLACRPPWKGPRESYPGVIALVQCCAGSGLAAHRDKIYATKEFYTWRDSGGKVFLQSWSLKGPRGGDKLWALHEEVLSEESFMQGMGFVRNTYLHSEKDGRNHIIGRWEWEGMF